VDGSGSIPGKSKVFFTLLQRIQAGSGPHVASDTIETGGSLDGIKAAWELTKYSPPSGIEVKIAGSKPSLPYKLPWRDILLKPKENFIHSPNYLY
jgi:hypothetical protein